MINLEDIYSLSDFQRNVKAHLTKLRKTKKPAVLTVNGKAALVVLDTKAYQALVENMEYISTIAGIQRGLQEADAGKGRPVREVLKEIAKKKW